MTRAPRAALRYANTAGAVVKLELIAGEDRVVQVETTRELYRTLHPTTGERLYVRPRPQVRIFLEPLLPK